MASIVKRKNRYSVVYTYKDDDGNQHQKWETFDTNADAKKRKTQIEFEQQSGTFIIPNATTVADLLEEYCSVYGVNNWAINRALKKLIQDNDLPDVVFHSFRHASITYKLKWNGGDMKSVQGDSGHARMDMVADVYSHIIDEDRRYNAQKFEEQFYNAKGLKNAEEGKTAPMPKFETSVELLDPMAEVQKESEVEEEKPAENSTDENAALLAKLLSNPETAALLKALAKTI